MVTRRLRLLVSSASAETRYIGMFRSKSAGLGSLQNELYAGNRRREKMGESEMQAELERLRALRAIRDNFRIDPIQQLSDRLSETN